MDTSSNENEVMKTLKSPPRRRRSTFFEKRDSIVPQAYSENIEPNICKELNRVDIDQDQDLLRYHKKLLAEREQWKSEVNHRRNKYHDLKQQYELASKVPSRSTISYSLLSNEDIEFSKAKLNISKIIDSQKKLHQSVKETQAMYRRAMELDNILLSHSERKVNEITDYILENSTIEPIE